MINLNLIYNFIYNILPVVILFKMMADVKAMLKTYVVSFPLFSLW